MKRIPLNVTEKRCARCGRLLPIDQFCRANKGKSWHSWCRDCRCEDQKRRYHQKRDKEFASGQRPRKSRCRTPDGFLLEATYYALIVNPDTNLYEVKKFVWENDDLDLKLLHEGRAFHRLSEAKSALISLNA